jgi:hypothetical protein
MKTAIGFAIAGFAMSAVPANAIDLSCRGVMHTYAMEKKQGTVDPGAAVVDLEKKRIATPVGSFRITRILEESITFDDPTSNLKVFGTLDRVSGAMNVFWRTPEQEAQLQAHLSSVAEMYAELKCSAAKRLF